MPTPSPHIPPTADERLEAMEYLLGQILLSLEADSILLHQRIARLEAAVAKIAPGTLAPLPLEHQDPQPFTMNDLGDWMQTALLAMRSHRSVSARQMVAIGELTTRVLDLGESLVPEQPPEITSAVQIAVEKAKRPPP